MHLYASSRICNKRGEDYQGMISEYVRAAKHALDAIDEAAKRGELSLRKMGH